MREVTKQMIDDFRLKKLGYDFMGYNFTRPNQLSFHHTIISHKDCLEMGLGDGYWYENGSILNQATSHSYLHIIESKDLDMFYAITSELIDENFLGRLDIANLRRIRDVLTQFEKEHDHDRTNKGKMLIKREFVMNRFNML